MAEEKKGGMTVAEAGRKGGARARVLRADRQEGWRVRPCVARPRVLLADRPQGRTEGPRADRAGEEDGPRGGPEGRQARRDGEPQGWRSRREVSGSLRRFSDKGAGSCTGPAPACFRRGLGRRQTLHPIFCSRRI